MISGLVNTGLGWAGNRKGHRSTIPHLTSCVLYISSFGLFLSYILTHFCDIPVTCSNCGTVNVYNKVFCPQETSPKPTKAMMNLVISVPSLIFNPTEET